MASSAVPMTNEVPKRKWLKILLLGGGAITFLILVVVAGLLFHYDNAWFRERILAELKTQLGRDCEIASVNVSFIGGSAEINGLSILNNADIFTDKHTFRAERVSAKVSVFPLLFSLGKKLSGLTLVLEKPEIVLDHRGVWPMEKSNIDDLMIRFNSGPPGVWPKQTGLEALDFNVAVHEGIFRYRDSDKNLGESRVQKFDLNAQQPGLGQPLTVKSTLELLTPASEKSGSASVDAHLDWIDAAGGINPAAFKNILMSASLTELDLPYVLRHLHVQGTLADGAYQWAPGKPFTGTFKFEAPTLAAAHTTAHIETNGAISILKQGKRIAGDIPGEFEFDLQGGWKNGAFKEGPSRFSTVLAPTRQGLSDNAAPKLLDVRISAGADEGTTRNYVATFKARAADLFNTDVGEVLNLKDQIGGDIDGKISASLDQTGKFSADGKWNTKNGYVAYQGVRQPSAMDMTFAAELLPNEDGTPEKAKIDFTASADSFSIKTLQPVQFHSINNPQKLAAQAKLQLHIGGREFWKQFGPLLKVMNLSTPLEEAMDADLTISGTPGSLALQLDGTMQRQMEPSMPIRLNAKATYDGTALAEQASKPFLTFDGAIKSADKSISIALNGGATRGGGQQVIELKEFKNTSSLDAITQLNKRFGAYVSVFLGPEYKLAGYINQTGHSRFVEVLGADGKAKSTELTMNTTLELSDFEIDGPPAKPGAPPLAWKDKKVSLDLGLALKQEGAGGSLALQPLKLTSDNMTIEGELAQADLGKLKAAFGASENAVKAWIDALPAAKVDGHVSAVAIRQLQAIHILPDEPLYNGELTLKAQYDPKTTRASISRIEVDSPLMKMKGSSDEFSLPELIGLLSAPGTASSKILQAVPTLALSVNSKPGFGERLRTLGKISGPWPLAGELNLSVNYDSTGHLLRVSELEFKGDAGNYLFKAPVVEMNKLAAFLDLPADKQDLAALAGTLPNCALNVLVKAPLFEALRAQYPELRDPSLNGDFVLAASYSAAQDQLQLETARFTRAPNSTLPVLQMELAGAASLKQLIPKLKAPSLDALSAFPQGIQLKNLVVNSAELWAYLQQNKSGGAFPADAQAGVYLFSAPLVIQNGVLKHGAAPGSLDLSLLAKTPLEWHPRPAAGKPPANEAAATFGGAWGFSAEAPLRISLANGNFSAQGSLMLDQAALSYMGAAPTFIYNKPAGTACRISFNAAQGSDGILKCSTLDLNGGPLGFALENLVYHTAAPQPLLTLDKVVLREGPLAGTLSAISVDMAKDQLRAQAAVDTIDLGKLISPQQFPPAFQVGGTLSGITLTYDGRISAFDTGMLSSDKMALRCVKANIRATGTNAGKSATLILNSDLAVDWFNAESKTSEIIVGYTPPGGAASETKMQLALKVTPRTNGEDLMKAAAKPGLPLNVLLTVQSPLTADVDALGSAIETLTSAATPPKPAASSDMNGIRELHVSIVGLNALRLTAGGFVLQNVNVPAFELSNLSAITSNAVATIYQDATVKLKQQTYQLDKQAHHEEFDLSNLNLHTLTGGAEGKKKEDYQVFGRLGGNGTLGGTGFSTAERRSLNGKLSLSLAGLMAQKNDGKASTDIGKSAIGFLGGLAGGKISFATALYSEDFGLFLNKMEFADLRIPLNITAGKAGIGPFSLVGKGQSEGLQIDVSGAVDLVTEKFVPNITLHLTKLPPKTQKVLRLDQLDPAERDAILNEFAQKKFQAIVLTGSAEKMDINKLDIVTAFSNLDDRVERLLRAKKGGTTTPPPAGTNPPPANDPNALPPNQAGPPPPKKKGGLLDDLLDGLNKKKEK